MRTGKILSVVEKEKYIKKTRGERTVVPFFLLPLLEGRKVKKEEKIALTCKHNTYRNNFPFSYEYIKRDKSDGTIPDGFFISKRFSSPRSGGLRGYFAFRARASRRLALLYARDLNEMG